MAGPVAERKPRPPSQVYTDSYTRNHAERTDHRDLPDGVADSWHIVLSDGHLYVAVAEDEAHGYAIVVVELEQGIANLLRALDVTTGRASAISSDVRVALPLSAVETRDQARELCRHVVLSIAKGTLPPRPTGHEYGMWVSSLGFIQRAVGAGGESPLWAALGRRNSAASN